MRECLRRKHRCGTVLIAAIVCLAIIVAMVGSMLTAALAAGRQLRAERNLRQCELLLQAGVDRAAQRLTTERDYRGETWTLAADQITGSGEAQVTIEVTATSGDGTQQLAVVAEYPAGSETSTRRSRTISLPNKQPSAQE
jgi:type II secretory pathway component PulK